MVNGKMVNGKAITEEKIREIFHEMFLQHERKTENMFKDLEQNITKLISSNLQIINQRLEKIENKIKETQTELQSVKESVQFTQDILIDEKVNMLREELQANIGQVDQEYSEKLRIMEDRARRNNLRIDGLEEEHGETWEQTEEKVIKLFEEDLGVTGIEIERAHRTGKKNNKNRTIVMKLLNYKDKVRILKHCYKLKGTNIFVNEDFSKETVNIRRDLMKQITERKENGEKNIALRYDKIVYMRPRHGRGH